MIDALGVIRERLGAVEFIITPTVIEELANLHTRGTPEEITAVNRAASSWRSWGFKPLNLVPVQKGIVEQLGLNLRLKGALPEEERNDGLIIAEAALLGCKILLTADSHSIDAQSHPLFHSVLNDSHVKGYDIVIATPREIVKRYFRQK